MKLVLALAAFNIAFAALNAYPATEVQDAISISKGVGEFYSFCNKSADVITVKSISFNPDPPKKDENLSFNISVSTEEEVTGGSIEVKVKWGFIPISKKLDLCTELKALNQACPLPAGDQTISATIDVPSLPSGHYTGSVVATGSDGKELLCVDVDIHF